MSMDPFLWGRQIILLRIVYRKAHCLEVVSCIGHCDAENYFL